MGLRNYIAGGLAALAMANVPYISAQEHDVLTVKRDSAFAMRGTSELSKKVAELAYQNGFVQENKIHGNTNIVVVDEMTVDGFSYIIRVLNADETRFSFADRLSLQVEDLSGQDAHAIFTNEGLDESLNTGSMKQSYISRNIDRKLYPNLFTAASNRKTPIEYAYFDSAIAGTTLREAFHQDFLRHLVIVLRHYERSAQKETETFISQQSPHSQ